jgi:hypothetical protein
MRFPAEFRTDVLYDLIQWNLYKAEPHGTENIFHTGQISALYKINNTDSSGREFVHIEQISALFKFCLIQVSLYLSATLEFITNTFCKHEHINLLFPLNVASEILSKGQDKVIWIWRQQTKVKLPSLSQNTWNNYKTNNRKARKRWKNI